MELRKCASFGEAAEIIFPPERAIVGAWADIRTACDNSPVPALKQKMHDAELEEAMTRAMQALKLRFCTPSNFREAIRSCTFTPASGVDKRQLYYFASKWAEHEENEERIRAQADETAKHAKGLMVIFHNRSMTAEELAEAKRRRHQGKEMLKRIKPKSCEADNS
jgi:hypothetical protein